MSSEQKLQAFDARAWLAKEFPCDRTEGLNENWLLHVIERAYAAGQGDSGAQGEQNHLHECPASEPEARLDELKDTVILLLDSGFTAEERRVYIKNRCKQLREVIALARPSESKETS